MPLPKTTPEEEIRDAITGLPGFDLDVYRDIFSSEYVNDVIYNHPERIRKLQPILDKMGFIQTTHFVFTLVFDNFWTICEHRDNTYRYQLKRTLLNRTRDALAEIHPASVAATLIGTDKVVALLECGGIPESAAEEYALRCAEALRDWIMGRTTFSISIGVSGYCRAPALAWRAYEQSFQALSASFAQGYARILPYRKQETAHTVVRQSEAAAVAKGFAAAVSVGDRDQCRRQVDHLFQRLSVISSDENYIRSYVVLVLADVVQYCVHLGLDANRLSQRLIEMIQRAFLSGTMGSLQEETSRFLHSLMGVNDRNDRFLRGKIHVAYAYIQQFYAEDIPLADLARLCGCSEEYFCRQFKKTYGAPYTALLARRRIARAKELLTEGGHTTADIAEAVGYHSLSHFCTVFRKETGRSPGEYRKNPD